LSRAKLDGAGEQVNEGNGRGERGGEEATDEKRPQKEGRAGKTEWTVVGSEQFIPADFQHPALARKEASNKKIRYEISFGRTKKNNKNETSATSSCFPKNLVPFFLFHWELRKGHDKWK
jgi:hypothetical protein